MDAGRALDALVAERVMGQAVSLRWCAPDPTLGGWQECESLREDGDDFSDLTRYSQQPCHRPYPHNDAAWRVVPHYSTDIRAAVQVLDRLRTLDMGIELDIYPDMVYWWVLKRTEPNRFEHFENDEADTVPLAICRAALAALKAVASI